ncbi:DNA cytosine methyltransferase [Leptospira wolffii]|uniref:DNA cytosine methyltransferase n=1 Tax=Leptospira wolffii TaxID=409998 RepID=UPI001438252C|nr:DNA cytosine methyltransferase [Leptospira wolffii]
MSSSQRLLFKESEKDYFNNIIEYFDLDLSKNWLDDFSQKLFQWSRQNLPPINVISIFSGAGGLDIGFRDAGFNIISHLEIEKDFCETLKLNKEFYNNADVINIDIRDYKPKIMKCDFIIGGPPCQSFSAAGRRAAGVQGIEDKRGTLFEEYIRLLEYYSPKGFLFENVYGITGAQSGKAWEMIRQEFSKAGYKIFFRVLNTADYGVPQLRERMIIVGVKNGAYSFPKPTHGPDSSTERNYYTAYEATKKVSFEEDESKLLLNGRHGHLLNDIPPGLNYSYYTEKLGHPDPLFAWRSKFSDYLYKADPNKPVRTIKAQGGQYTGPLHWNNRYFTVNEYKRLQSFPDEYKIFGNRQRSIQQIGNSVPPQFARIMALSILQEVFKIKLPFTIDTLQESDTLTFRKRKRELTSEYFSVAQKANTGRKKRITLIKDQNFIFSVDRDFKVDLAKKNGSKIAVTSSTNSLFIKLIDREKVQVKYTISIKPSNNETWRLPYDIVTIESSSPDIWSYVVAWKSFEYIIKNNGIMDDLVQLNGYYQYSPKIDFDLRIKDKKMLNMQEWQVLLKVIESKPVRKIISYKEMANFLSVKTGNIVEIANFLKSIGYEIRNHNTNPQIPRDHILLPYSFPTLTNLSVQLRKAL